MRLPRLVPVFLIGVFLLGNACAGDRGFAADQPTDRGALEPGQLTGLPAPGGAAPITGPSQQDGAVTESFKVTGLSPADAIQWYATALSQQAWAVSNAPAISGEGQWKGLWAKPKRLLQVTAVPLGAGTGGTTGNNSSQVDLVLRPAP